MKKKQKTTSGEGSMNNLWDNRTGVASLFLLIILLPFIYSKNTLDPVIMPRLLMLGVFLAINVFLLFKIRQFLLNKWMLLSYGLYLLFVVLSVFQAVNPLESLVDIVKTSALFFILIYLMHIFRNEKVLSLLPGFVNVAALIAIFIGVSEYFKILEEADALYMSDGKPWYYSISGLMGHKNQYAISLMLMLPFTGYGIYRYRGAGRFFSIFTTSAILILIVLLRTRSVWVGTTGGLFLLFVMILVFKKQIGLNRKLVNGLAIGFIAVTALSTVFILAGKESGYSIPALVKNITDTHSATNINRIKIWEVTGDMIADSPVLGVGAGNWKLNTHRYYGSSHFDKSLLNWLRPHNDYLWVWAETGIFGLLAFLSVFIVAGIFVIKVIFSHADTKDKLLMLFILAGLAAYMLVSMFTFPRERINHQVYLILFFAVISVMILKISPKAKISIPGPAIMIPALVLSIFTVIYSFNQVETEKQIKECRSLQFSKKWSGMLEVAKEIPTTFRNVDADGTPISWYAGLAADYSGDYWQAIKSYAAAIGQHPGHVKSMNNLGIRYVNTNSYGQAIEVLNRAVAILPDYLEAKINLATSYFRSGDLLNCLEALASIPDYQMNDKIDRFKESVMYNSRLVPPGFLNMDSDAFLGDPVDKYIFFIKRDPEWLVTVEQKAQSQRVELEEAIVADAHFIAHEKEPENYLLWYGLDYYKKQISKNKEWVAHVRTQAREKNRAFSDELEAHARSQFAIEYPRVYAMFVETVNQKRRLMANSALRRELENHAHKLQAQFPVLVDVQASLIARAMIDGRSAYDEKIDGYIAAIRNDIKWLSVVQAKARQKKTTLHDELLSEAKYMIMREEK